MSAMRPLLTVTVDAAVLDSGRDSGEAFLATREKAQTSGKPTPEHSFLCVSTADRTRFDQIADARGSILISCNRTRT